MSFSDLTFLFYFLPLFFAVYYILPFRFKNAALVLGSFAFYFIGAGARDTLLLSGVLLLHYALARAMAGKEVRTRKALLIIALAADLFCLVYFKYAAFILENLGKLMGTAFSLVELALPLGVSFYLFQSAGYLIDVYRGEEAEKNLIDYAAFTIAFPQLTMGPILRYREWRGALKERTITREDVFSGFELFVVGLCFKVLLADQLAPLWASLERIGYEYLSTPLAWLGAVSYSLQLYFDFSGYSLMAMGLGQMLALPVPRNFDLPYTARSVSEFYRRWHITLGVWLKEYVFYSVALSPKVVKSCGKLKKRWRNHFTKMLPTAIALLAVWLCNGLWHGPEWKYIVYGLYYFVIIVSGMMLEPLFRKLYQKIHLNPDGKAFTVFRHIRTLLIIFIGETIFGANTLGDAFMILSSVFRPYHGSIFSLGMDLQEIVVACLALLLMLGVGIVQEKGIGIRDKVASVALPVRWASYMSLILVILVFGAYGDMYNLVPFIYGNF